MNFDLITSIINVEHKLGSCEREGKQARRDGYQEADNPYRTSGDRQAFAAWRNGFRGLCSS